MKESAFAGFMRVMAPEAKVIDMSTGEVRRDRIETVTQAFREWRFRSGRALSQAALSAQLRTVRDTARTAIRADAEVRRRLLVATADLASVTAWSSNDLAHHDRARQMWLAATELHARLADLIEQQPHTWHAVR